MTFELIKGSGNRYATTIRLDKRNCSADLWWCEKKQEYHWALIWEDGGPWGTHMHSGIASTRMKARADIVATMIFIEDSWPTLRYFEGA